MGIAFSYCCNTLKTWDMTVAVFTKIDIEEFIEGNRACTFYHFPPVHMIVYIAVRKQYLFSEITVRQKCRKNVVIVVAVCSHEQRPHILFKAREEGSVVKIDEIQVVAATIFLVLL